MWERIRNEWVEGRTQNLIMLLRYNKDNLIINIDNKQYQLVLDCCIWNVKRWKLNKIGMEGIVDIEFENGKTININYFPKKRPFVNDNQNPTTLINFSTILRKLFI